MIVHKFGGTSVGDSERFRAVAEIILDHHQAQVNRAQGRIAEQVVVLSAMSGVTDQLVAGALAAAACDDRHYREIKAKLLEAHLDTLDALLGQGAERLQVGGFIEDRLHELELLFRSIALLGELTVRGRDRVTSLGEQLSTNILAALLRGRGLRAQAVSAAELIVTDNQFGAARPHMELTCQRVRERLLPLIQSGITPVVTGYIAATEDGIMTTLGRGGSDFSAAILGACLGAQEVLIWSDVDGILTADPNFVPSARTLEELSYDEAAELAHYGADVLHPKTIQPVVARGIPLRLLNSFNPGHPGTLIVQQPSANRARLPAIISTTGLSMIRISRNGGQRRWGLTHAGNVLLSLDEAGIEAPMFSQSFSENSLNLVVRQKDRDHCLSVLKQRMGESFSLQIEEQVATVSVVGVPGWNERGIVPHTFTALGKHGTRVIAIAQAASEHSVSICIPEGQTAPTVQFLHRELGLEKAA